jgi:hypothetical protein
MFARSDHVGLRGEIISPGGGWDFLSGACRGGIVKSPERAWVSFPQGGLCQAVRDIPLSRIFNAGGGPYSRRDDFLGDTPGR